MKAVVSTSRVLIIDNNPEQTSLLTQILEASPYEVVAPLRLQEDFLGQVAQGNPDIILIGADFPGQATLNCVASLHENHPCPMVMFSQDERSDPLGSSVPRGNECELCNEFCF